MNNRLLGLFAALQGGTRRKPKYLNTGALVSWVYAIKLSDSFDVSHSITNTNLLDIIQKAELLDSNSIMFSINSVTLQDSVLVLDPNNTVIENLYTLFSVRTVTLTDVIANIENTTSPENTTVAFSITNFEMFDNVKIILTDEEVTSVGFSVSDISLGAP